MKEIQQALELASTYLQGIWLRRRYIIITAWLVCPAGWFYVYNLPPVYQASTQLYVERSTFLDPILRGLTINTSRRDEISLLTRTILSRANLQKIARQADMDLQINNDQQFEALIDALQRQIRVTGTGRQNIYSINYSNPNPQRALKIVQETLNAFMENRVGSNRDDVQAAMAFLDREIADYEQRLIAAEQRLAEFKQNRMRTLPGSESNFYSQLSAEKQRLEAAKLDLKELETRLQSARGQLTGVNPASGGSGSITTQYDARIKQLEAALDNALIRFTELHPDVVEIKRLLATLSKQRDDELAALAQASTNSEGSGFVATQNSVFHELQLNVARLETEVASTKVRVNAFQGNVATLESQLNLIPEIEAQFTGLNRDYEVTRSKYEQLLVRREASELSQRADASEQDVQFRIIEPPRVPFDPSGPNRKSLYSGVLLLGFGAGIAMAFLRSLISPVLTRASQLSSICDFPVFGVISHTDKAKILRQIRLHFFYFTALTAMLLMLYVVLLSNDILFGRSAELLMRIVR